MATAQTALRRFPHGFISGAESWIQRTSGPGGLMSYWYAFAGNPNQMAAARPAERRVHRVADRRASSS